MYNQATKKFNTISDTDSDSVYLHKLDVANGNGWESGNKKNLSSQILLGVNNRYYLTIEGENMSSAELGEVLQFININLFPE